MKNVVIAGGEGKSILVKKNDYITVTDIEGQQVADFVAIKLHDKKEYLSTAHTRAITGHLSLIKGQYMYSNYRNKLLKLTEDTVGIHDTLYPCCDPMRYYLDFGIENHKNCRDNFVSALKSYGIEYWCVPDPVNLFQNAPITEDGNFDTHQVSKSNPGDFVTFKALENLIIAISACPQDMTPLCGWEITDIAVSVY